MAKKNMKKFNASIVQSRSIGSTLETTTKKYLKVLEPGMNLITELKRSKEKYHN